MGATSKWARAIADWEQYQRAIRRRPETIKLRVYHVQRFAREVGGTPESLTSDQLLRWLAGKDWKPNTVRAYRASLRAFYTWAMGAGQVTHSPVHLLPPPTVPRAMPRPTPEHIYRVALHANDPRVRLAVRLGGACGLRRGEMAKARQEHVVRDLVGWSLWVKGKGGHERLVPLPDEIAREIRSMPAGWLFPSSHGGHLTPAHLGKLVAAELQRIEGTLNTRLTTHTLRHRCGTSAYETSKDLRAVQELLGHSKPETTAIYTQVSPASVRAAMMGAADGL
jgi:integrase/recombinase XerC